MVNEKQRRSFAALLTAYPLQQEVMDQVLSFVRSHPTAFPLERATTVFSYTYDDGRVEHHVVQLQGSVSMVYKSQTYRLPVIMSLPHGFPREAPLVFMNPKPGMVRNEASVCVDASLRVLSGYLDKWEYPFSSLERLYADMKDAFGKSPPLRQRQAGGAHHVGQSQQDGESNQDNNGLHAHHREALVSLLHRLVNEALDVEHGCLTSKLEKEVEAGGMWESQLNALEKEVAEIEGRILEVERTDAALSGWLQEAEDKVRTCRVQHGPGFGFGFGFGRREHAYDKNTREGRGGNRHGVDEIDAYAAVAPMTGPAREALEAEACLRAVQDAVRELDEALAGGRITWSGYKRMLSQLMTLKFQARFVLQQQQQQGARVGLPGATGSGEGLDCTEWKYPEVEDAFGAADRPNGGHGGNGGNGGIGDGEDQLQDVLAENPLQRGRYRDLVSSTQAFRSMP